MSGTKTEEGGPMLPLPLQFLAAWLAGWLGRVLQQQVDYLRPEITPSGRGSATGNYGSRVPNGAGWPCRASKRAARRWLRWPRWQVSTKLVNPTVPG